MLTNNLDDTTSEFQKSLDMSDRDYLLPYLDKMLEWNGSKEDWKRRFNAYIPFADFEIYNAAAIFFTGAVLEIVGWAGAVGKSDCLVLCKGYYEAIDGNDDPISA